MNAIISCLSVSCLFVSLYKIVVLLFSFFFFFSGASVFLIWQNLELLRGLVIVGRGLFHILKIIN